MVKNILYYRFKFRISKIKFKFNSKFKFNFALNYKIKFDYLIKVIIESLIDVNE